MLQEVTPPVLPGSDAADPTELTLGGPGGQVGPTGAGREAGFFDWFSQTSTHAGHGPVRRKVPDYEVDVAVSVDVARIGVAWRGNPISIVCLTKR